MTNELIEIDWHTSLAATQQELAMTHKDLVDVRKQWAVVFVASIPVTANVNVLRAELSTRTAELALARKLYDFLQH